MDDDLSPPSEPLGRKVGISIPQQKDRLEEKHRCVPHHRRTAEWGEHHLRDHRLDQKQQRRAEEQSQRKQNPQRGPRMDRLAYAIWG